MTENVDGISSQLLKFFHPVIIWAVSIRKSLTAEILTLIHGHVARRYG